MAIEVVKIQEFRGHTQAIYAMTYQVDSRRLFSGSGDGFLVCWNLGQEDGTLIARLDGSIYSLECDSRYLFAGTRKGILYQFSLKDDKLVRQAKLSTEAIYDMLLDGEFLYVLSGDGILRKCDASLDVIGEVVLSKRALRAITRMDGQLAVGNAEGEIIYLDFDLQIKERLQVHQGTVFALAYDPQAGYLYSGGKDATIKMFETGGEIKSVPAHLLHVHRLCMNSTGDRLLSSSMDKTIKLWSTKGLELLKVIDFERHGAHVSSVNKILWIDKNILISCSDDRTLMCFEIQEK